MATFAVLNEDDIVTNIIIVDDADCQNEKGDEVEQIGVEFLNGLEKGIYVQTSRSGSIRTNYAVIGEKYLRDTDTFSTGKAGRQINDS